MRWVWVPSQPNQTILWGLSKPTGSMTGNENGDAGEEIPLLLGFSWCKCLGAFQINLRGKKPLPRQSFWWCCRGSQALLSLPGLHKNAGSAKNTSLTPQQWFVWAFLEERIPLISKEWSLFWGLLCFHSGMWTLMHCSLKTNPQRCGCAGSSLHCSPYPHPPPASAWEKTNPLQGEEQPEVLLMCPLMCWAHFVWESPEELPGSGVLVLHCAFSATPSVLLLGASLGHLGIVPPCPAPKWLLCIKDLIVLIVFWTVSAGGVAGVEADTLLAGFELHFRSLSGVLAPFFFPKHEKNFFIMNFSGWWGRIYQRWQRI